MKKVLRLSGNSVLYYIFFGLLGLLALLFPKYIPDYIHFVNWKTIATIAGLMIATTGIEQSALLDRFTELIISHSENELTLSLRLVVLSVIFSAFLTNDVSLFILIPITLHIQKFIKNDTGKLIVFEAIGVNVGSALTPIGNPQNIYLFHKWGITPLQFVFEIFPMFVVLILVLLVFILIFLKKTPLEMVASENRKRSQNKPLFYMSVLFIALYFAFSNKVNSVYILFTAIFLVYILFFKDVLKKTDWWLLILFCAMFIDFSVIAKIPQVEHIISEINLSNSRNLFGVSVLLSQIMSNVPATIFLTKYSVNYKIIAYGVNIGGNGFIIASLANIIAIKLSKKDLFLEFHKYSIPFLLLTSLLGALLFV